jgi:hypothetical protein
MGRFPTYPSRKVRGRFPFFSVKEERGERASRPVHVQEEASEGATTLSETGDATGVVPERAPSPTQSLSRTEMARRMGTHRAVALMPRVFSRGPAQEADVELASTTPARQVASASYRVPADRQGLLLALGGFVVPALFLAWGARPSRRRTRRRA